jgi:hypothetical protein
VTPALPADQDFDPIALLPDGRVLLVGAHSASAETYDPKDNTFRADTVPASLYDYTFVLLKDGLLLGVNASGRIFVLYDPVTGDVSPTGSMVRLQLNYQTTQLADGRLLFTGGTDSAGDPVRFAQIYDPATGKFALTGFMATAREGQSATLLADGRVLVAGGDQGDSGSNPVLLASAEIYDPGTGRFTETKPMLAPRSQFGAVVMEDGRVLVAGGEGLDGDGNLVNLASAETFDPAQSRFEGTAPMSVSRLGFGMARLRDGDVLVAGGSDPDGNQLASAELYRSASGSFSPVGPMNIARQPHVFLLPDGRVLLTGGVSATGLSPSEIYWP